MLDRHRGSRVSSVPTTAPPSLASLLAIPMELLPLIGLLLWPFPYPDASPWRMIVVVGCVSGVGWVVKRNYLVAALMAIARAALILVPFLLIQLYGAPGCDECTTRYGVDWYAGMLWWASLWAQPILSAVVLAGHAPDA